MKFKLLICSAGLLLGLTACGGTQPGGNPPAQTVAVTGVSLNKSSLQLNIGQSETLVATVNPEGATNKKVVWTATGEGIVSVDEGVVNALKAGISTVTVTTEDGGYVANCQVTVADPDAKPSDAVDLAYATAETLGTHGDDYCYFNDPEWWSGASATVNTAYYSPSLGKVVFDYTYNAASNPAGNHWSVQLMRKNTSLTANTNYKLSFNIKMNKAGKLIVNDQQKDVVVGDNSIEVVYKQTDAASLNIQFSYSLIGSSKAVITNVNWEEMLSAPEGVVVNENSGNYIIAFAAVSGADSYKAYYVNAAGEDVANEVVTNGGQLTKVSTLPDGKYKVYVTALKGTKESPRSTSFGQIVKGEQEQVVPAGGPKTNMEFGQEHKPDTDILDLPDDKFVFWNDQNWCGSEVSVSEAYTEEGTVHATYSVVREYEAWNQGYAGCNFCFQIMYKNTSLKAGSTYTLSYKLTSLKGGNVTANGKAVALTANTEVTVSASYTEVANNASFVLVFPSSMGDNTIVISNISWTPAN